MNIANESELDQFIKEYPEINMLEILMPDMNGIVRCKRIPRGEFGTFFRHGVKGPASTTLLNVRGEFCDEVALPVLRNNHEKLLQPISQNYLIGC